MESAKNRNINELAEKLKTARDQKKALDAEVDELTKTITELDLALSDAMAEAEMAHFNRNGTTFYLTSRLYASPRAGKQNDLNRALQEHGYGDLVLETVSSQALASFCKEQIALSGEKEKLPDWLDAVVSTFEKVTVGVRKGTTKKHS